MEWDIGADVTLMSETTYKEMFPHTKLRSSSVLLKTYSGECLPVLGELDVQVEYEQQKRGLVLIVVAGTGPSLLGRNWLEHIQLNWREIKAISYHPRGSLQYVLDKYSDIFSVELGTIKSYSVKLSVKSEVQPKFFRPRTVPYAYRSKMEEELDRLEWEGILDRVTHTEWATPLVVVPMPDGKLHLRGDFKVTVNQALNVDQYPLPTAQDLYATLAGGKKLPS